MTNLRDGSVRRSRIDDDKVCRVAGRHAVISQVKDARRARCYHLEAVAELVRHSDL